MIPTNPLDMLIIGLATQHLTASIECYLCGASLIVSESLVTIEEDADADAYCARVTDRLRHLVSGVLAKFKKDGWSLDIDKQKMNLRGACCARCLSQRYQEGLVGQKRS